MGTLTDTAIRNFISGGKAGTKSDGEGLTLTLSEAGTAAWTLRYYVAGKRKEKTLGRYPDISLKKARELATRDRAEVQQGEDVARLKQVRKAQSRTAWTVRQLADDYEVKSLAGLAQATIVSRKQKIRDYVLPKLGHLPARDVTGTDVVEALESVADKSPKLAKPALGAMRAIFTHGLARKVIPTDPTAGITAQAIVGRGANRPARDRVMLTDAEIHDMLALVPQYGRVNELMVRILLSSAVRVQALTLTEWQDIDFDQRTWTIRAGDGRKSKRDFTVPMTEQVAGYFSELRALAGEKRFVIPVEKIHRGRDGDRPTRQHRINAMLEKMQRDHPDTFKRKFTPHDLRSTARSHFAALGIDLVVAERMLNHSLGGLVAVYDQHDYLDERRRGHDLWQTKLAAIEAGATNVIPFSKSAA